MCAREDFHSPHSINYQLSAHLTPIPSIPSLIQIVLPIIHINVCVPKQTLKYLL